MKKILFCLLVATCYSGLAQDKNEVKNLFWGSGDLYKKANTVPDKWKNESAVIIYKNELYNYHKFGINVTFTSAIRKRIKLQDAAAVEEFSEFEFKDKFYSNKGNYALRQGTQYIGVKVIKPDGKEKEIDVDKEAKTVDNQKKLAISNLEVGDIIDFYYYNIEPFKSVLEYGFDPEETTLGDIYPTMNMKLQLETENDFFINFNTYNGAPNINEIATGKGGERKYELSAQDIPKNEFPRWYYPLVDLPCYKFQVFFARSGKYEDRAKAFLSESEKVIKKQVTKEDVFNYYNEKFVPDSDISQIKSFLKDKTFASDEEKVREVYYYTRHQYYTQYIEAFVVDEAKIFYPYEYYDNAVFFRTEEQFINHFMGFLKKNAIDYDIIIGTERYNGPISDLLIKKNVTLLLKINTKNPIYMEFFTPFTSADQFNYNLENTKAYALQVSKGKRVVDVDETTLPSSTVKDNVTKVTTTFSLNDDMSGLKLDRETSYYGHFKESEQSDRLYFFDYVYEDYAKYGTVSLMDRVRNKKKQEQYKKEMQSLIDKLKDKQKEKFKKQTADDFDLEIDNHSFTIKNTGRFGDKTPLIYDEQFDIKNNLIKKAGENYLVEIGKMLTSQIEITQKEKDRKNNVYLSYPRSFENEIVFEIPAGYTVAGLDKLNKKVENETGGFTSTASITGNKLTVKTTKYYSHYFEPNTNWAKMVAFLDAAYQFTQEKILLKKN